jgi:hypothetical protein
MTRLVFGEVKVCGTCKGSGDEHPYRMAVVGTQQGDKPKPIRKRVRCTDHPCVICGGTGVVPA